MSIWSKDIVRGIDDWSRRAEVGAKPWYASTVDKGEIDAHRNELAERQRARLQTVAARQASEQKEKLRRQNKLKEIKQKQASERKAREMDRNEERRIAKEKAEIEKEQTRILIREEKAEKESRARDEAVEKATRQAVRQAEQAEQRQRKVRQGFRHEAELSDL